MTAALRAGDTALVFDSNDWAGQDIGDNSQFWKRCVLREVYRYDDEDLAKVEWPDGRVTRGHIVSMMRSPYRLVVTLEFDTDEHRQEWLREHEDGRCSDVYPWSTVHLLSVEPNPTNESATSAPTEAPDA